MKRNIDVRIENAENLKSFILAIEDAFEQCQHSDDNKSCGECMDLWVNNLYKTAPLDQQFNKEEIKVAQDYKKKGFNYCIKNKYDKRVLFAKDFPTYNGTVWENEDGSEFECPTLNLNLFKYMAGGELYPLDKIIQSKKRRK